LRFGKPNAASHSYGGRNGHTYSSFNADDESFLAGNIFWTGESFCGNNLGKYDRVSFGHVERGNCYRIANDGWICNCLHGDYRFANDGWISYRFTNGSWLSYRFSCNYRFTNDGWLSYRFSCDYRFTNDGWICDCLHGDYRFTNDAWLSYRFSCDYRFTNGGWLSYRFSCHYRFTNDGWISKPQCPRICKSQCFLGIGLRTGESKWSNRIFSQFLEPGGNPFARPDSINEQYCNCQSKPPAQPELFCLPFWIHSELLWKSDSIAIPEYQDRRTHCDDRHSNLYRFSNSKYSKQHSKSIRGALRNFLPYRHNPTFYRIVLLQSHSNSVCNSHKTYD
jgi:hypothetical protein